MKKILKIAALLGVALMLITTLCPWVDASATIAGKPHSSGSLLGIQTIYGGIVFAISLVALVCLCKKHYGVVALLGLAALVLTFLHALNCESSGTIIEFTNGKAGADKLEMFQTLGDWKAQFKDVKGSFTDIGGLGALLGLAVSFITTVCSALLYRKAKKENA